jgi:hypothetical protein
MKDLAVPHVHHVLGLHGHFAVLSLSAFLSRRLLRRCLSGNFGILEVDDLSVYGALNFEECAAYEGLRLHPLEVALLKGLHSFHTTLVQVLK